MNFSPLLIENAPPVPTAPGRKRASRKIFYQNGERAENFYAQALIAPKKNAFLYGELASGATVYAYVDSNPINGTDWSGLGFYYGGNWTPNVERPMEVGNYAHRQFFGEIRRRFPAYQTNTPLVAAIDPTRPDVVGNKNVWELKPDTCQAPGAERNRAIRQVKGYAERGGLDVGDPAELVGKAGFDVYDENFLGQQVIIHFYPDPDPTSGLIFYKITELQSVLQAINRAWQQSQGKDSFGLPLAPAPILVLP